MSDLVSIVIVNWNGEKWLKKCIGSLYKQEYKNFEIIVVDNNSSDKSLQLITSYFPKVRVIKHEYNQGFAKGNTTGIKVAKGKYILLLNSDTWVKKDFLTNLISFYLSNKYDVISPLEQNYTGSRKKFTSITIDPFGHPVWVPYREDFDNFYLTGVCLFFKKDLYIQTRGFDENFFMYCEEVDWFWRLKLLKKSFSFAPNAIIFHAGANVQNSLRYEIFLWRNKNTLQMLLKNYSWYTLLWVLPILIVQNLGEILIFLLILKPKISYTYIYGWFFALKSLRKIIVKRKWIQANRKVSDQYVLSSMYKGLGKIQHMLYFLQQKSIITK
ncbi:MAG TPA: glycosyltransferase family 2 protein [Vicingus sp.]|nr:glycosyltransferase family 2 protein [Candidatus Woesebacteria bacterium]HRP59317.1 glycosyltransferase family 2 protein [Vicingus sp.]